MEAKTDTTRRTRNVATFAAVAGGVALVVAVVANSGPSSDTEGTDSEGTAGDRNALREQWGGSNSDDAVLIRPWKPGQQFIYTLAFDSDVNFEGASTPAIEQELSGTWEVTVLDVDAQQDAWMYAKLSGPRVVWQGEAPLGDAEREELDAAFETAVTWRVHRDGEIEKIGLAPGMLAPAQQTYKHLSGLVQFVVPIQPKSSWELDEIDSQGRLAATYRRAGSGSFLKTRANYQEVLAGPAERTVSLGAYTMEASWSAAHPFEDEEITEIVRFDTPDLLPTATVQSTVVLSHDTDREVDAETLEQMRASVRGHVEIPLYGDVTTDAKRAALDKAWIAGLSLDAMLEQLLALGDGEEDRHKRMRLHMAMTALFRQDAKARAEAFKHLENKHEESLTLVSALGDSGHPESQKGLLRLVETNGVENEVRGWATIGLTRNGHPPREVVEGLEDLFDDPQLEDQARFGLGTAVSLLLESDPDLAEEAAERLLEELANATTHEELRRALLALGNAAYPGAFAAIEPYLRHRDVLVRQAAVAAIRDIPGEAVEVRLSEMAVTDGKFEVRREALHAMGGRPPSGKFLPALFVVVKNDPVLQVRQAAVAVAVKSDWQREAVVPILEYVASNEANASLKRQAEAFLAGG